MIFTIEYESVTRGKGLKACYRKPKDAAERFPSNAARIQHRETLRQAVQTEIYKCRAEKLR